MNEKLYPLADYVTANELRQLGFTNADRPKNPIGPCSPIQAVYAGIRRVPKAGEWYLSGAVVTAYKAKNDMTMKFPIASLVRVKTQTLVVKEIVRKV